MTVAKLILFLASTIKAASIFIFGSTGEILTEKSGHLNMGIPGIMFLGALGGMFGERVYLDSIAANAPLNGFLIVFVPMIFAMIFAAVAGLLFAFFTVTLKCNHNVTGLTLTTFGVGISSYFLTSKYISTDRIGEAGIQMQSMIKYDWGNNWFGSIFLSQSLLTYISIVVAILVAIFLSKTRIGLNLRACGENPAAADAAGINVDKYRYLATIVGAAIAGLGGLAFELDVLKGFFNSHDAVDAFGWLCLSLVIFSIWKPSIAIGASFLFGGLQQISDHLVLNSVQTQIVLLLPYAVTIVVLVITSIFNKKNSQPPAGLGITYFREDR